MLLFAVIIGVVSALLGKHFILDAAENWVENPGNFWHGLHIGFNILIGLFLIGFFWSWIAGAIGLGFLAVGIASIWVMIL